MCGRRWSPLVVLALLLASLLWTPPAGAQSRAAIRRARVLFAQGVRQFDRGRFRPALNLFTRAYSVVPAPSVIYNIAQCHFSLGNDSDAAHHFRLFLQEMPDAPNRAEVEGRLRQLDARMGQRRHQQRQQTMAEVRDEQERIERTERAEFHATIRGDEEAPEDHDSGGGHVKVVTWTTLIGGVLVAGAGGLFALDAASQQSDLDDDGLDCHRAVQQCLDLVEAGDRSATLRTVLLSVGGAALVAGTVMLILDLGSDEHEDSSEARGPTVSAALGPGLAVLEARGSW